ncbi:hypothetical protein [Klebsiella phage pKV-BS375-3.1]|nr:hypothetical protein [Klebsiella phage pKV-BS375-3.1]
MSGYLGVVNSSTVGAQVERAALGDTTDTNLNE